MWLWTNRDFAHFAQYQESYCSHIYWKWIIVKVSKIESGRKIAFLHTDVCSLLVSCRLFLTPRWVKLLPQSTTKLCTEMPDPQPFIRVLEVTWLGRSWLYSRWESHNSSMIVKFCLGHSHLGVAYFERIIRLFWFFLNYFFHLFLLVGG